MHTIFKSSASFAGEIGSHKKNPTLFDVQHRALNDRWAWGRINE